MSGRKIELLLLLLSKRGERKKERRGGKGMKTSVDVTLGDMRLNSHDPVVLAFTTWLFSEYPTELKAFIENSYRVPHERSVRVIFLWVPESVFSKTSFRIGDVTFRTNPKLKGRRDREEIRYMGRDKKIVEGGKFRQKTRRLECLMSSDSFSLFLLPLFTQEKKGEIQHE